MTLNIQSFHVMDPLLKGWKSMWGRVRGVAYHVVIEEDSVCADSTCQVLFECVTLFVWHVPGGVYNLGFLFVVK
jgi:hypothetical protein